MSSPCKDKRKASGKCPARQLSDEPSSSRPESTPIHYDDPRMAWVQLNVRAFTDMIPFFQQDSTNGLDHNSAARYLNEVHEPLIRFWQHYPEPIFEVQQFLVTLRYAIRELAGHLPEHLCPNYTNLIPPPPPAFRTWLRETGQSLLRSNFVMPRFHTVSTTPPPSPSKTFQLSDDEGDKTSVEDGAPPAKRTRFASPPAAPSSPPAAPSSPTAPRRRVAASSPSFWSYSRDVVYARSAGTCGCASNSARSSAALGYALRSTRVRARVFVRAFVLIDFHSSSVVAGRSFDSASTAGSAHSAIRPADDYASAGGGREYRAASEARVAPASPQLAAPRSSRYEQAPRRRTALVDRGRESSRDLGVFFGAGASSIPSNVLAVQRLDGHQIAALPQPFIWDGASLKCLGCINRKLDCFTKEDEKACETCLKSKTRCIFSQSVEDYLILLEELRPLVVVTPHEIANALAIAYNTLAMAYNARRLAEIQYLHAIRSFHDFSVAQDSLAITVQNARRQLPSNVLEAFFTSRQDAKSLLNFADSLDTGDGNLQESWEDAHPHSAFRRADSSHPHSSRNTYYTQPAPTSGTHSIALTGSVASAGFNPRIFLPSSPGA
ncbi:hypothetical protein C8R46DRAFT_1218866 [Mycena filopes]|nr:hypothetical protein C8R46DRAFT_1218866 [Mycena filopes]